MSVANKELRKRLKTWFVCLDVMMAAVILFNIGAITLTSMLVVARTPEPSQMILEEVNPVAAEIHDLPEHPESTIIFRMFIRQSIIYAFIIFAYLFIRFNLYAEWQLWVFTLLVLVYVTGASTDFFNNLGYYIGIEQCGG